MKRNIFSIVAMFASVFVISRPASAAVEPCDPFIEGAYVITYVTTPGDWWSNFGAATIEKGVSDESDTCRYKITYKTFAEEVQWMATSRETTLPVLTNDQQNVQYIETKIDGTFKSIGGGNYRKGKGRFLDGSGNQIGPDFEAEVGPRVSIVQNSPFNDTVFMNYPTVAECGSFEGGQNCYDFKRKIQFSREGL